MAEQLASMKPQVYKDERPPEVFERYHRRARTRDPNWVYELVRTVTASYAWSVFRLGSRGELNVPMSGPALLAPNHGSFMDHFFTGASIRRKVRFMAKSQLFSAPMDKIYSPGGVFPVRRGAADEEAFITAHTILERGGVIVMYPEGGRSRTGELADRARPGIGRLALESGAPVVPVAILGSHKVRNWKRLRFPKVRVSYGRPMRWERVDAPTKEQQQAVADEIFGAIQALHAELRA